MSFRAKWANLDFENVKFWTEIKTEKLVRRYEFWSEKKQYGRIISVLKFYDVVCSNIHLPSIPRESQNVGWWKKNRIDPRCEWIGYMYVQCDCEVAKKRITLTTIPSKWLSAFHAISLSLRWLMYAWCQRIPYMCMGADFVGVCAWYAFSLSVHCFRHIIHTPVFFVCSYCVFCMFNFDY